MHEEDSLSRRLVPICSLFEGGPPRRRQPLQIASWSLYSEVPDIIRGNGYIF